MSLERRQAPPCDVCGVQFSRYNCPRCALHYCSLSCYRAPLHLSCSESFYKEEVERELKETRVGDVDSKRRMLEILKRVNLEQEGELEPRHEKNDSLRFGSRSSSLLSRREGASHEPGDEEEKEEDEEEWTEEIAEQLASLDLDSAEGAAQAYALLPPSLRAAFLQQLSQTERPHEHEGDDDGEKSGREPAMALPPWLPWWETTHAQQMPEAILRQRKLVQELDEDAGVEARAQKVDLLGELLTVERRQALEQLGRLPACKATAVEALARLKPQPLQVLLGQKAPSPALVCHTLHAVVAYAYVWRLHDGDVATRPAAVSVALKAAAPALTGASCDTPAEACARFWTEARAHPALASDAAQCSVALRDAAVLCQHADLMLAALADACCCVRDARREAKAAAQREGRSKPGKAPAAVLVTDAPDNSDATGANALPAVLQPESQHWTVEDAEQLRRELAPVERKLFFLLCWCLEHGAAESAALRAAGAAALAEAAVREVPEGGGKEGVSGALRGGSTAGPVLQIPGVGEERKTEAATMKRSLIEEL